MLICKNLLIAIATLTLLGTATATSAHAFTLSFQSIDGKVTGNIVDQKDWPLNLNNQQPFDLSNMSSLSITGQGWNFSGAFSWLPGIQIGTQWSFRSFQGFGVVKIPNIDYRNLSLPGVEPVNNMPPDLPHIWPILERTSINPSISLLCHSELDCLGDFGVLTLNMSFRDTGTGRLYSWIGYGGQIQVTAWNPTGTSIPIPPPPTNSIPEPSSTIALLLLGTGWFLRRKLAV
jgi:hypothetical protein